MEINAESGEFHVIFNPSTAEVWCGDRLIALVVKYETGWIREIKKMQRQAYPKEKRRLGPTG